MNTPKRRINVELLLGISATFLSLAALVVSVFQTRIAREQQYASVWPSVTLSNEYHDGQYYLYCQNNGVGPAIIKKLDVTSPITASISLILKKLVLIYPIAPGSKSED